jgi:hypothetical protein
MRSGSGLSSCFQSAYLAAKHRHCGWAGTTWLPKSARMLGASSSLGGSGDVTTLPDSICSRSLFQLVLRSLSPATKGGHYAHRNRASRGVRGHSLGRTIGFRLARRKFPQPAGTNFQCRDYDLAFRPFAARRVRPPAGMPMTRINGIEEAAHENESSLAIRPSRQRDPRQLGRLIVMAGWPRRCSLGRCSRRTHLRMLPTLALCRQRLDRYGPWLLLFQATSPRPRECPVVGKP